MSKVIRTYRFLVEIHELEPRSKKGWTDEKRREVGERTRASWTPERRAKQGKVAEESNVNRSKTGDEQMGELAVMDRTGDTKVVWDPDNEVEVANAKRTFDDLRKKGFLAYTVNERDASKGTHITEFDPEAGKIILSPPIIGG